MIRLNLLPRHERVSRRDQQRYQRRLTMLLLSASLIVAVTWLALAQQHAQQREHVQQLQRAHQQQDQLIALTQQVQQDIAQLHKQRTALDTLQQQRHATAALLTQLAVNTPAGIVLNQLSEDGQQLSLQGFADNHQDIVDLLITLKQEYPSSLVDLRHTTQSGARQAFLITVVVVRKNREQD